MACILRIFQRKSKRKLLQAESERFAVSISVDGTIPDTLQELYVLEECLSKRMSHINKKVTLAFTNAMFAKQRGNMRKYLAYITEHKKGSEEVRALGKRLVEVVERQNNLLYGEVVRPVANPPKIENTVIYNPVHKSLNASIYSSPKLVSSRPIGRPRPSSPNTISSQASDLSGRS